MNWPHTLFDFDGHKTSLSREVIGGLTTFTTMSYIVVVNPAILSAAGIPEGPSFVATALTAAFGCYFMALYANRPFAIAPYMGENAFIAFTVCKLLGFRWQTALAAIFIAGVLFVLMTLLHLRQWVVEGVPASLRYSFAVGIGLFLTFIGLNQSGLVILGVPGAPVRAGQLTGHPALVAMFGFVLLAGLIIRKVPGAILIGIVITAIVAFVTGVATPPHGVVSLPPSIAPILWQLDFRGALTWRAFPVVLTIGRRSGGPALGRSAGDHAGGRDHHLHRTCAGDDCFRRLCRVSHGNRGWRPDGPHCPGHWNLFPADVVLLAVGCGHSGPGIRTGTDYRRAVHAGTDHPH